MVSPHWGSAVGSLKVFIYVFQGKLLHKKYDAGEFKCHGAHVIHYNVLVVTASCLAGITNSTSLW